MSRTNTHSPIDSPLVCLCRSMENSSLNQKGIYGNVSSKRRITVSFKALTDILKQVKFPFKALCEVSVIEASAVQSVCVLEISEMLCAEQCLNTTCGAERQINTSVTLL